MSYIVIMNDSDDVALDVSLLRTFVALLELRHVTRAAAQLGLTQSATSHGLKRLRIALRDPLFVRGPRGIVPTDRALALGPRAIRVLEDLDGLQRPPGPFDPRALRRTFVIGGADFSEIVMLPKLVRLLAREAPGVDVVFRPSTLSEDLERGSLDVVLGLPEQAAPRLLKKKLLQEEFVCMLRRGHPALKEPLTPERFAALRHVLVAPSGGATGVVDDALRARGLSRRVAVRTATFVTAPLVVAESDCVTTMPLRIAQTMMRGRALVLVPPPVKLPGFSIALVFHERSKSDPAHAWLRTKLTDVARDVSSGAPARRAPIHSRT
jgi:DNA-binding transcriptional LysR family regulator